MTDPIPSAGETTIIGLPAIQIPITTTGDRPLTQEDIETIARLAPGTALLISTRGAVSGSRYLLDEDEVTVGATPAPTSCWTIRRYPVPMPCSAASATHSRYTIPAASTAPM